MTGKLVKHGNGFALVIDPEFLKQWGIDESTPLDFATDGQNLIVSPAGRGELSQEDFEKLLDSVHQRYSRTFKRLAEES